MKKVIFMVIDALASEVFVPALQRGDLPNFQALVDAGVLLPESIAVFPSLTPSATSSLITGEYPSRHNIFGFHWFDQQHNEIVYYGDDFWLIWQKGFGQFFEDFLVNLNQKHLRATTLFQQAEQAGLTAASLNFLIFHGDARHPVNASRLLKLLPLTSGIEAIFGPKITYFGDFVDNDIPLLADVKANGGPFNRFGFDDDNTINLLLQLSEQRKLPPLTVAYLPDNDFRSHEVGPEQALGTLQAIDKKLAELFALHGGVEGLLTNYCLVITGDHSQTAMHGEEQVAGIKLDQILGEFALANPGAPWGQGDELLICPDMRSAQLYLRTLEAAAVERIVKLLIADPRVDQVIWRADRVDSSARGYHVATRERGSLHFWRGDDGPVSGTDVYGGQWSWRGELTAVDGHRAAGGRLEFGNYPNAFERIAGGLMAENSGHIWATAQPGHEFRFGNTSIHLGGGSHGSLHRLDSISPLLVAGAPAECRLPQHPRSVDVAPLCASLLGLVPVTPVDASRAG